MDRSLTIAIFSDSALPILNGVSVSIDALVRELRRRGHSVHVFTSSHMKHKDHDPNTYRFPAAETPWTKGYPLAMPPFFPLLPRFRKIRPDIVHTHTPWTIGYVGMKWAEMHSIPVVSTYHTHYDKYAHYVPFMPNRTVRTFISRHTTNYYNRVQHVITPSEASCKWLMRHKVTTPISVIPTGISDPKMLDRHELRQMHGLDPDARVLLYVGRIALEKNMEVLFEGAAAILQKHRSTVFWLVGDGPYRDECAEMARSLGIGDRVNFVGFVPRSEVDQYYAISDIFLFSSMTETQGLVVAEAMSYGLPAVVVSGGGAAGPIEDGINGFSISNSPRQIADASLDLLENDDLYSAISAGARETMKKHTTKVMTDRIIEVYQSVLHAERPRNLIFR